MSSCCSIVFCDPHEDKIICISFRAEGLFVPRPVPQLRLGLQSLGLPQKDSLSLFMVYVRVSMNQQYRISEHEILYYDNSKVQLFVIICLLCNTTHGNTKG
jgi:hypothetical protein